MADEPEEHLEDEEYPYNESMFPEFPGGAGDFESERHEEEVRRQEGLDEKEVKVAGVWERRAEGGGGLETVVRLRDSLGRTVPMVIGQFEAMAIAVALEGSSFDRPLTHDLLKNILDGIGGRVERVLIDDLWHRTFYAKISITLDGKTIVVDARPSDAIALGLRAKAPIYMAEAVIEAAAVYEEF